MTMEHIGDNLKKYSFEQPASRPQESSKKEPAKEPFIPFPRFLVEHYRNHLITYRELELHNWMRLHANMFGIASVNVHAMLDDLPHFKSVDRITKVLRSLRRKKYIHYQERKGRRGTFEVRFDHWLLKGGKVQTLDRYFEQEKVRGESGTKATGAAEATPSFSGQSPRLNEQEHPVNTGANSFMNNRFVRGDKNDNKIETKEIKTSSSSSTFRGEAKGSRVATRDFVPQSDAEERCKRIAIEVGDEYINFILSKLKHKDGGIEVIENAFQAYQDVLRIAEEKGDIEPIKNLPAFFNRCVKDAIEENQMKKSGRW
ncbi:MAG: hypothetical protein KGL67_01265 [Patescibacteria group bacterium]|nr:hypothetical protein [Patescibacteria group bacterium]